MSRSSLLTRLLLLRHRVPRVPPILSNNPPNLRFTALSSPRPYSSRSYGTNFHDLSAQGKLAFEERWLQELSYEAEQERTKEREEGIKAGLSTEDLDNAEEEDYLGIEPLIQKLEKKPEPKNIDAIEPPSDSDSEAEDEDKLLWEEKKFEKKLDKFDDLLDMFAKTENLDEAFDLMKRIDKFEKKHFPLRPEYRVIGELMNRLKVAEGKEKFLLQMKLNRALRIVEWKEAFDPNDPANYGIIKQEEVGASVNLQEHVDEDEEEPKEFKRDEDDLELYGVQETDTVLLEKLKDLDKKLEEKLAEFDHTFGKKGRLLEEEIRDLAEERNWLTEQKRKPLYRKGFDVRLIDVNRTIKVTKGGRIMKFTAMLVCGNYHGVIGFSKAKGPSIPIALQKAYEKCFQNLHYVERHEEHTIAHAIQTSYKKTKVYLWPASTITGMKAGRHVQTVLTLAGYKNVKSKVIGSRNPYNTVKAVFKALNAIETPKDVQEKFGRTVVESYLL